MQHNSFLDAIKRSPGLGWVSAAWHLTRTAAFLLWARCGHVLTRLQQHGQRGEGSVWTRVACRSLIATPVDRFRSVEAATAALTSFQSALDAAGVTGQALVSPPELARFEVSDISHAVAALTSAPDNWYMDQGGKVTSLHGHNCSEVTSSVIVFRAWATGDGRFLAGADVGIAVVHQADFTPAIQSASFPVDAVITWVDGADPLWQARKNARRAGITDHLHETADNEARYESLDELKYCLRSITMYAPWIRRIFLVTDDQVPAWLETADTRVTVVNHREIFKNLGDLPTFNSHAIEARLHHIRGLAEHYISFNDDLFLARALPPSFFFTPDGSPRVFLARDEIDDAPRSAADTPVVAAAKNNRELLRELTGYRLRHKLKHVPHPQLKSLAHELEDRAPRHFAATAGTPFRGAEDISVASSLVPHYVLAQGRGTVGSVQHFYADVASPELRWRLPVLQEQRTSSVVCINATTSSASSSEFVRTWLETLFPVHPV